MAEEIEYDFDAIVVGGGMSGLVAAYELAKAEKSVLVMERGEYCGAKNMTGGRVYALSLRRSSVTSWRMLRSSARSLMRRFL